MVMLLTSIDLIFRLVRYVSSYAMSRPSMSPRRRILLVRPRGQKGPPVKDVI
jgi:hypothetical protein